MKMSGDWQTGKGAVADLGFVPTKIEIVRMEMSKIDFSECDDMPIQIGDFTGGEGDQLNEMYKYLKDIKLTPHAYYNEMHTTRFQTARNRYEGLENFNMLNTDFLFMRCRSKNENSYKRNNFQIIRNNPPYTFVEHHGQSVRAENLFFTENALYNTPGGIMIFELPLHQLIQQEELLKKICFRYENINIFKFPKEEFRRYKQIVVLGTKKSINSSNFQLADEIKKQLIEENIPYLDDDDKSVIKLSVKACKGKLINIFRDGRITDVSLTKGYMNTITSVWNYLKNKKNSKILINEDSNPIIEQLVGHKALELNSGKYNGIQDNVLIKGGYVKEVVVSDELDGDTKVTTRTEVIKPTIAITNKAGDILLKGQL